MQQMRTDIELIKLSSKFMETRLTEIVTEMKNVKEALSENDLAKKIDLEGHAIQDRWMFALVITLLVCIFGKLIHG